MNDQPVYRPEPGHLLPQGDEPTESEPASELFGAIDIVEAFTALRHELKLQVRNGRELQQVCSDSLRRIELRLASPQREAGEFVASDEGRKLAEALAETEDSLRRVVETLARQSPAASMPAGLLQRWDSAVGKASWVARKLSATLLAEMRALLEESADSRRQPDQLLNSTHQGLELLLARIHRLMEQCQIQRIDVLHQPFDAEVMHAIDVIDMPSVPSAHVAEQLRPAYSWRGKILRYADVRLAR